MTVVIHGMTELRSKLARLAAAGPAIADTGRDVIRGGVAEDARVYVPVLTGELRSSIHEIEEGVVADAPHAIPVEFGTVDTPPQPFMRPAADGAVHHVPEAAVRAGAAVEAVV
jgi:HK97 gp10 family phage protein